MKYYVIGSLFICSLLGADLDRRIDTLLARTDVRGDILTRPQWYTTTLRVFVDAPDTVARCDNDGSSAFEQVLSMILDCGLEADPKNKRSGVYIKPGEAIQAKINSAQGQAAARLLERIELLTKS